MKKLKKVIQDIFDVGAEGSTSIVGAMFSESLVGQFLPGVTTAVFSYRQKKAEQNMERFAKEVKEKEKEFDERLSKMESGLLEDFKSKYFGIITDYVVDEVQEEKIRYIVNGMLNLSAHEKINEDFVLTYYDTLKDLRLVDIAVLKIYYSFYQGIYERNYESVLQEFNIEYDQYEAVREKLVRAGLLLTRREDEIDKLYQNVIEIQSFLENVSKGKSAKISRFKTLSKNDSYSISKFGRNFIEFFVEEVKKTS